ncbi:hypothetical protein O3P69_013781 [Scylla paramamosain]|uniref:Uncharacterized protein n=1 Tax=Scylla paramamosain TaxID=85552 RepID=A0AAW0SPV2_SCYPA
MVKALTNLYVESHFIIAIISHNNNTCRLVVSCGSCVVSSAVSERERKKKVWCSYTSIKRYTDYTKVN